MKSLTCAAALALTAPLAFAEETRQLDAHEHGVGQLDIAVEGSQIALELHAPGADIVGFEYAASSAEDRAKVDGAVATLARPLDLFVLPAAAGCSVIQASAELESEAEDEDHAEHKHDDHGDEDHAAHEDEAGHTEFHASYLLECADTSAVSVITFAYFDAFPNALELEVQLVTDKTAGAFEVERAAPTLDLRSMF